MKSLYFLLYQLTLIAMLFGSVTYLVFWRDASPWWFLLSFIIWMTAQPSTGKD